MYMAIFTHTFFPIAPTKNSNKKGHFPHEIHAKNVLFTYSHQPDSLEMYFSNQPDNLYYQDFLSKRDKLPGAKHREFFAYKKTAEINGYSFG